MEKLDNGLGISCIKELFLIIVITVLWIIVLWICRRMSLFLGTLC